jgi:hypothetical protein
MNGTLELDYAIPHLKTASKIVGISVGIPQIAF